MPKAKKGGGEVAAPANRGEMKQALDDAMLASADCAAKIEQLANRAETVGELTPRLTTRLDNALKHLVAAIADIEERGAVKERRRQRAEAVAAKKRRALEDYARQHGIAL